MGKLHLNWEYHEKMVKLAEEELLRKEREERLKEWEEKNPPPKIPIWPPVILPQVVVDLCDILGHPVPEWHEFTERE